jgi:hypothetical protein
MGTPILDMQAVKTLKRTSRNVPSGAINLFAPSVFECHHSFPDTAKPAIRTRSAGGAKVVLASRKAQRAAVSAILVRPAPTERYRMPGAMASYAAET